MGKEKLFLDRDDFTLMNALKSLDKMLAVMRIKPFTLKCVGGFALLAGGIRKDVSQATDVDYVGQDLSENIKNAVNAVGRRYNLGKNWINNDLMLSGTTLEDLEFCTGKLHFHKLADLKVIRLEVLDKKDLLRMKVIAVDTSLSAVNFGGEFTREKDLNDIILLAKDLHIDLHDYLEDLGMSPMMLTVMAQDMILAYEKNPETGVQQTLQAYKDKPLDEFSLDEMETSASIDTVAPMEDYADFIYPADDIEIPDYLD